MIDQLADIYHELQLLNEQLAVLIGLMLLYMTVRAGIAIYNYVN